MFSEFLQISAHKIILWFKTGIFLSPHKVPALLWSQHHAPQLEATTGRSPSVKTRFALSGFSLPDPARLVLLGTPSFCIKVFFKFFCIVAYVKSLFFFYSWIRFHCVNTSHFVYPFTCHWIFAVFLTLWFKLLSAFRYKYSCVYFYFSWMGTKKCNCRVMT